MEENRCGVNVYFAVRAQPVQQHTARIEIAVLILISRRVGEGGFIFAMLAAALVDVNA
jgi:hypothetical protein